MSSRKPAPRLRTGTSESADSNHFPPDSYNHYNPSAPTQQPHGAAYAGYPPRQHYAHAYPGHYPPRNMGPDQLSSSPPQGFHPPLHQGYPPPSGRNLTAVTPESGQIMPPDFMSPPSNMKRRPLTPGSSLSPSKKPRPGAFHFSFQSFSRVSFFNVGLVERLPLRSLKYDKFSSGQRLSDFGYLDEISRLARHSL
jgi:hypothetical protein